MAPINNYILLLNFQLSNELQFTHWQLVVLPFDVLVNYRTVYSL